MGIFGAKVVDKHTAEWQFEHYEILIRNFSTGPGLPEADLQLPKRENFLDTNNPEKVYEGDELAKFLLEKVKSQCGLEGTDVVLMPTKESKPEHIGGSVILQTQDTNAAAGRYIVEQKKDGNYRETITYDQDLVNNPAQLIATFAHELSHLLHNRAYELPTFDAEILYEMFTDLTAVYMGYGVFLANGRFSYESNGEMWGSKSTGYLPESELIFATAIFMKIKNLSTEQTKPFLKKHLQKMLVKAMRQLDTYAEEIQRLRELEPYQVKTG